MKIFLLFLVFGQIHTSTYKQKAAKVYVYIQKNFYNQKLGQYKARIGSDDISCIWPAGCIQFLNLSYAAKNDLFYKGQLDRYFQFMEKYWDSEAYEPCINNKNGRDKYTDDNIQMAYNLYVAYTATRNNKYLEKSQKAFKFCRQYWDDVYGGGIWMHQLRDNAIGTNNKKSCLSEMAMVPIFLSQHGNGFEERDFLDFANKMLEWTENNLKNPENILYFDDISTRGLSRTLSSWNSAVIAESYLARFKISNNKNDLEKAINIVEDCNIFYKPERNGANEDGSGGHFLARVNLELFREIGEDKYIKHITDDVDYWYSEWEKLKGRGAWQTLEFVSSLNCRLWIAAELEK